MKIILIALLVLYILRTRPGFGGLVTVLWPFNKDGAALFVVELIPSGAYDEYSPGYIYHGMNNWGPNSTASLGIFTPGGYCILGITGFVIGNSYGLIVLNRFAGLFLYDEYYIEAKRRWLPPLIIK